MSLRNTLIVALAAATLSCCIPLIVGYIDYGIVLYLSFPAIYSIVKYRKRGWWPMLGFLPALFWPYVTAAPYYACYARNDCL